MLVVRWVCVAAWTAAITLLLLNPAPDSRDRMLFTVTSIVGTATLGLQVLVAVMGDRLRTVSDTYLIGYAHGRADVEADEVQHPLRLVQ